jgi:methyltransferase-like protein/SAM-dependent methyltransferase
LAHDHTEAKPKPTLPDRGADRRMAETQTSNYDEVPYENLAFHDTHPDRLATVATLFGMAPPPVDRCRVLELGCAGGGNLIPMALAAPEGQFVGIDLSPRQIAAGRQTARSLGIANIELRAMDLADVGDDLGRFDYVISHGVYSWVPASKQGAVLDLIKRHLAPEGVAYVSYNTLPGWHARGMVRELMEYHVASVADPHERAQQARGFLDLLAASAPNPEGVYARTLAHEAALLRNQSDTYLLHDHLEAENHPVYVHEFVAQAGVHGLAYVADARLRTMPDYQPPTIRGVLDQLSRDPLRREQYLDFLRNRTFRRSVLCHDAVALTRPAAPEAVTSLRAAALVAPRSPKPDVHTKAVEEFHALDGGPAAGATNDPLLKAALMILLEHWPRSVPFADLHRLTLGRLDFPPSPVADPAPFDRAPRALAAALLQCYATDLVALHAFEPHFVVEFGDHPTASPLARLQAEAGTRVTSLRHRVVELSAFDRLVLRQLDGHRDWYAILDALDEAVAAGAFPLNQDGQPITDSLKVRQILGKSLDPSLRRLATSALLVA